MRALLLELRSPDKREPEGFTGGRWHDAHHARQRAQDARRYAGCRERIPEASETLQEAGAKIQYRQQKYECISCSRGVGARDQTEMKSSQIRTG